jgi:carboxymethylenebutenolidase
MLFCNATIPGSEELIKTAGKIYEPVIYAGAGHCFIAPAKTRRPVRRRQQQRKEANKKARDAVWVRWKELLRKL